MQAQREHSANWECMRCVYDLFPRVLALRSDWSYRWIIKVCELKILMYDYATSTAELNMYIYVNMRINAGLDSIILKTKSCRITFKRRYKRDILASLLLMLGQY